MKNELIIKGIYNLYLERKKYLYEDLMDTENYLNFKDIMKLEDFETCKRIYNCNMSRKWRTKERLLKWIYAIENVPYYENYYIVFGTLTFSDKKLSKTAKETRRRYIERFLKEESIEYIANIDYGKINDREHYHFIALVNKKINCNNWKSIINIKKIKIKLKDANRVKNYILKINNHSYKESTKNEKLIQDRNREIEKMLEQVGYKETYKNWKLKYA